MWNNCLTRNVVRSCTFIDGHCGSSRGSRHSIIYSLVMVITCERVITIRIYLLLLKMLLLLVNCYSLRHCHVIDYRQALIRHRSIFLYISQSIRNIMCITLLIIILINYYTYIVPKNVYFSQYPAFPYYSLNFFNNISSSKMRKRNLSTSHTDITITLPS